MIIHRAQCKRLRHRYPAGTREEDFAKFLPLAEESEDSYQGNVTSSESHGD